MNKQPSALLTSNVLILAGLVGLFFNINNYDRYYLNELLTTKTIVISDRPEYINSSKGTSRYSFRGKEYQCRFWLSEGALDAVRQNDSIENAIKAINISDTIQIEIRVADDNVLQDYSEKVRVIGLKNKGVVLVDPKYVNQQDNKSRNINLGFSALLLVGSLLWRIIRYYKRKKLQNIEN